MSSHRNTSAANNAQPITANGVGGGAISQSSQDGPPTRSRNARAQARHRAKRKAYIEQLEETVTKLQHMLQITPEQAAQLPPLSQRVRELEVEVKRLRAENDRLRHGQHIEPHHSPLAMNVAPGHNVHSHRQHNHIHDAPIASPSAVAPPGSHATFASSSASPAPSPTPLPVFSPSGSIINGFDDREAKKRRRHSIEPSDLPPPGSAHPNGFMNHSNAPSSNTRLLPPLALAPQPTHNSFGQGMASYNNSNGNAYPNPNTPTTATSSSSASTPPHSFPPSSTSSTPANNISSSRSNSSSTPNLNANTNGNPLGGAAGSFGAGVTLPAPVPYHMSPANGQSHHVHGQQQQQHAIHHNHHTHHGGFEPVVPKAEDDNASLLNGSGGFGQQRQSQAQTTWHQPPHHPSPYSAHASGGGSHYGGSQHYGLPPPHTPAPQQQQQQHNGYSQQQQHQYAPPSHHQHPFGGRA